MTGPLARAVDPRYLTLPTGTRRAEELLAEERVEPIMRPQADETVRLDPVPALQHPFDRGFRVVVADPGRDTTEVFERADVTIEEHFLGFVQIRPYVTAT